MGRDFQVLVSHNGHAVNGLSVKIQPEDGEPLSALTGRNGVAVFHRVRPGTWYLGADSDSGFGGGMLDVKGGRRAGTVVPFDWPSTDALRVRHLQGTLYLSVGRPDSTQPGPSIDLLDAVSGKVLKTTTLNSRREFDFGDQAPGLYFIHLKPYAPPGSRNEKTEGMIPVDVDSAAPTDRLELNLRWSSCGMDYSDMNICPTPELRVSKLKGRLVSDPPAPVGVRASEISIFDSAGEELAHPPIDGQGSFSAPEVPSGDYAVRIVASASSPIRATIHIEPTSTNSSLEVTMKSLGCSTIRAQ